MREQQVLAKAAAVAGDLGAERDSGQVTVARQRLGLKGKRNERRPRRNDTQTELFGHTIAEWRGADFRHRQPAGGDDDRCGLHRARGRRDAPRIGLERDPIDRARHPPLDVAALALGLKHRDNVARRFVAEELSQLFLVMANPVTIDESNEIARCVARERRAAEIRILGKEVRGAGADIREIAAAPARDADLLAQYVIVLDQEHLAAALSRLRGAHHAGRTCADDDDVVVRHQDADDSGTLARSPRTSFA